MEVTGWSHGEWRAPTGETYPRIEAHGEDLGQAFARAAWAFHELFVDPAAVRAETAVTVFCESADLDLLFADWINTLIYEIQARGMFFSRFEIVASGIQVKGRIWGEQRDPVRHPIRRTEVRGVAFTGLSAREAGVDETGQDLPRLERAQVQAVLDDTRHVLLLA